MRTWAARRPVLAWYLLALGISWSGWIPYGLAPAGALPIVVPEEIAMVAQCGPFLATLLLAAPLGTPRGAQGILAAMVRWRTHPGWYLFVLAVPLAVASRAPSPAGGRRAPRPPV
jgi:hypothetical protein